MPRTERIAAVVTLLLFLAALVAAVRTAVPPPVLPADAPAAVASGGRAHDLLRRLAVLPHAAGFAPQAREHTRVRDLLAGELQVFGPVVSQRATAGRALENLSVRIAGTAPTGTVLCVAHYDSVARGPGAGDDGTGIVTWLEVLRALRALGWQPKNDVIVLFTDGEELGLLGASLFAADEANLAGVRTVINIDAIGNGGRALLFELGAANGPRVAAYAAAVAAPAGSTLAEAIYHSLPNDTDLSVFLQRGIGGFNLALACGSAAYHSPHDSADNVDPRSLQHLCDTASALLLRVGDADLATLAGPDRTFFDCCGLFVVSWPRWLDLGFAVAALGLVLAAGRRGRIGWRALGGAAILAVLVPVGAAAVATAAWWGIDRAFAAGTAALPWVPGNTTSAALMFAGSGLVTAALAAPRRSLAAERAAAPASGAQLVVALGGVAMCLWLPGGAFVCALPVLLLAAASLVRGPVSAALRPLALLLAALVWLPIAHQLVQLLARDPVVAAAFAGVCTAVFARLDANGLATVMRLHPAVRWAMLAGGLCAFAGSAYIARVLVWRTGAF